jgi:16S rRNA (uracil1498-N3)-methyltransferase
MSSHRFLFYCPEATPSSSQVVLTREEHHHLSRALRCRPDDITFVTNGRGLILECRIASVGRASTTAVVESVVEERHSDRELVLALGAIRKDKFEQAFEQCVELGVTRCLPFVSEKAHAKGYTQSFLGRLRKIAVAAIKQSFRPFLPDVGEAVPFDELVQAARQMPRVVVGRQGAPPAFSDAKTSTLAVVGPEAGLTDTELAALESAGAEFAGVSSNRLRSETAAVALIAALWRGD